MGNYWGYLAFTSNNLEEGKSIRNGDYLAGKYFSIIPTIFLILGLLKIKNNNQMVC